MAYCSSTDLTTALGETKLREMLGVTSGTAETFPTADETSRMKQAIEDADKKIDLYCSKYNLPMTGTAADYLKQISIDFTEWNIRNDRTVMTEECQIKYDEWIKYLTLVVNGKANIPGADTPTETSSGTSFISGNEQVFGRANMDD